MPLNKLDNFIKNTDGRILYVSPSDLDSTDSIDNQGNSLARPFKTVQRALLEAARFSYVKGDDNDITEKTTILLLPGEHLIDNRPGFRLYNDNGTAKVIAPDSSAGTANPTASSALNLSLESNFDLTQVDNILYKFNSIYGGVIVPRGCSIVGLDLRKTKIRPKYVPNPTDPTAGYAGIFKITGACYLWQFSLYDARESELAYTSPTDWTDTAKPTFSHHKLTCFEYIDGVNKYGNTGLTDLDMYYAKLSNAYGTSAGTREIDQKYPADAGGFAKQRPEWEIVGAFDTDVIDITAINISSSGSNLVTVTTNVPHEFNEGTPIKIRNVVPTDYNISTKVQTVLSDNKFTYLIPNARRDLDLQGSISSATVVIETDTVTGASPYIFNISLRSVWGMNGMHANGSKASGFKSMVVAQFTGVSLQKDDRAFVKYFQDSRQYVGIDDSKVTGADLSSNSSSTDPNTAYHLDANAIYRRGWETSHVKASNDSFVQVVSVFAIGFTKHFDGSSGADYSITNSNSNFGQISLNGEGFKADAFDKDNNLFLTNIIPPKAITTQENTVDWISIDVGLTTSPTVNPNQNRLYLFGFTSEDIKPPVLTQGYRIGGKKNDRLFATINGNEYYSDIVLADGINTHEKVYHVDTSTENKLTLASDHTLNNSEKIIIESLDGDLPENVKEHSVYYVITSANNTVRTDGIVLLAREIQLATSESDASLGIPVTIYGGRKLKISSRVHDKTAGELGHPVQWDETNTNWYISVKQSNPDPSFYQNTLFNYLDSVGVAGYQERTDPSYIKRIADTRSLDQKLYKLRVVIPKEISAAKAPEPGFIIQESSDTGVRNDTDFILPTTRNLTSADYKYNKNNRYLSNAVRSDAADGVYTITVTTEKPHNLQVGNDVKIYGIKDSTLNTFGEYGVGYNGKYPVKDVLSDMEFTYEITAGVSTNPTWPTTKDTSWPRFERNDVKDNLVVYRSLTISDYVDGQRDGVYHLFATNANVAVEEEFTDNEYSQNIADLYPQQDRDNIDENPIAAKSYALRSPLGKVITNNLRNSVTRETVDKFSTSFGVGLNIANVEAEATSGITTLTFDRNHGYGGIVDLSLTSGGVGYNTGTYYNVKILEDGTITNTWRGATATVTVNSSSNVSAVTITNPGSGYTAGNFQLDESVIGNNGAEANVSLTLAAEGISEADNQVVQITGIGTAQDGHYRILDVPSSNRIAIARTNGDPQVYTGQYSLLVGPAIAVTSTSFDSTTKVVTVNCTTAHGLVAGNKFKVVDTSNANIGDFLVKSRVGVNTFTYEASAEPSNAGYILKHGFSANDGTSDQFGENLSQRGNFVFDKEIAYVNTFTDETRIRVTPSGSNTGTVTRFNYGSYIQIDDEIMRVASNTLGGTFNDEITVVRGALATRKTTHLDGSLIRKIKPIALEIRRPTTMRASGHTFEYLGYGPGNYSTGLPQVQIKSLDETEEQLAQAQKKKGAIVVYTGMNNRGDSFQGNSKTTASSGEISTFDIPTPTIKGESASRLSAVFDEIIVKERIVVEGGASQQVLSQFDGPVNVNQESNFTAPVNVRDTLNVRDETQSTNTTSGAVIVSGGVGIAKNLNVGGELDVDGTTNLDDVNISGALNVTGSIVGAGGTFGNIQVGVTGDNEIDTSTGDLILDSANGTVNITDNADVDGNLNVDGDTTLNGNTTIGDAITDLLTVNAASEFDGTVNIDNTFNIRNGTTNKFTVDNTTGNTNIEGTLIVGGKITGNGGIEFGNVQIGVTNDQTIDTSDGDLNLSAASNTVSIQADQINLGQASTDITNINGELRVSQDIVAFYSSDIRLKTNITSISEALSKLNRITGCEYMWNELSSRYGTHDVGVIAQDVQNVLPEAVIERDNGYLAVDYQKLIPLLIQAFHELNDKFEAFEQSTNLKITELEQRLRDDFINN